QTIGPELTGSNRRNLHYLLSNVIDPSASVPRDFRLTVVATVDGRVVTGMLTAQSSGSVTIRTTNATVRIARDDVEELRTLPTSMMPDGLLDKLDEAQVRDLIAWMMSDGLAPPGSTTSVPPFRVIYSNDTTHTLSCLRPEERRRVGFTDGLLRKSITEAGGVDAHFLQPGLGWIPWWQSKIYSPEDHQQWLRETYGINGISLPMRYLLDGGDMLQTLVDTCREIGVAPFLSFRLNDGHHTRDLAAALEQGRPTPKMARHYWENYQAFRIGPDVTDWGESVFDWAIPEVRDYKFSLMEEACRNYDI
ncbi:Uncharacterized protein SCF082_LOCUS35108, partial [Durusdinium trenchii]